MDIAAAQEFLRNHHRGVLVTRRRDERLQTSPILGTVDAAGLVVISSRETAFKVRNLRRDPRASLCVFSDQFFGPWIHLDGTAEIVSLPEAMDGLVDTYRRIAGDHPDWDEFRQAMEQEQRVLIRMTITDAGPQHSG